MAEGTSFLLSTRSEHLCSSPATVSRLIKFRVSILQVPNLFIFQDEIEEGSDSCSKITIQTKLLQDKILYQVLLCCNCYCMKVRKKLLLEEVAKAELQN